MFNLPVQGNIAPSISVGQALLTRERLESEWRKPGSASRAQLREQGSRSLREWRSSTKSSGGTVRVVSDGSTAAAEELSEALRDTATFTVHNAALEEKESGQTAAMAPASVSASSVAPFSVPHSTASAAAHQRRLRDRLDRLAAMSERQFQASLASYDRDRATLVASVSDYLTLKSGSDARRQQRLYSEWQNRVYQPIQRQIQDNLDRQSTRDIAAKRRANYQQFLDFSSERGGFSNIDYDNEMEQQINQSKAAFHVKIGKIDRDDPLKADIRKNREESKLLFGSSVASSAPRSKAMFECKMWDKLEATPYGRYNAMFADIEQQTESTQPPLPSDALSLSSGRRLSDLGRRQLVGSSAMRDHQRRPGKVKLIKPASEDNPAARSDIKQAFDHYSIERDQAQCYAAHFGKRGVKKLPGTESHVDYDVVTHVSKADGQTSGNGKEQQRQKQGNEKAGSRVTANSPECVTQ